MGGPVSMNPMVHSKETNRLERIIGASSWSIKNGPGLATSQLMKQEVTRDKIEEEKYLKMTKKNQIEIDGAEVEEVEVVEEHQHHLILLATATSIVGVVA